MYDTSLFMIRLQETTCKYFESHLLVESQQLAVSQRAVVGSIHMDVEHSVVRFAITGVWGCRDVYYAKHGTMASARS